MYLGSILHYSLTCDADVDKRIASATAAFGVLRNIFTDKYLPEELKGEVLKLLFHLLYSTVAKLGLWVRIYSSAFVVSITSALAQCAV